MSEEWSYKRQADFWIKISVIMTPLLSGAVTWGVVKTTITNLTFRMTKVESWVENQNKVEVDTARAQGESASEQKEMNRRLERIEVILDSRLRPSH